MQYKDYGLEYGTYVLVHTTGFGVMESPLEECEIVASSEDREELVALGQEKYPRDSSGWTYDSCVININTSTEAGKIELQKFQQEFEEVNKWYEQNPDKVTTVEINGQQVRWVKSPEMDKIFTPDTPQEGTSTAQFMIFDVSKDDTDETK